MLGRIRIHSRKLFDGDLLIDATRAASFSSRGFSGPYCVQRVECQSVSFRRKPESRGDHQNHGQTSLPMPRSYHHGQTSLPMPPEPRASARADSAVRTVFSESNAKVRHSGEGRNPGAEQRRRVDDPAYEATRLRIPVADRETPSRDASEAAQPAPALAFRRKSQSLSLRPTRGLYRQVPFARPNDTFLEHSPFRPLTRRL
jgi:hypothetical protein